jgi:hypothetical protein
MKFNTEYVTEKYAASIFRVEDDAEHETSINWKASRTYSSTLKIETMCSNFQFFMFICGIFPFSQMLSLFSVKAGGGDAWLAPFLPAPMTVVLILIISS